MVTDAMKVATYYNNNDVRIEEMLIPEIGPKELLVKMKACGICGSDVMEWYRLKTAPRVLGHEMTGDIVKVYPMRYTAFDKLLSGRLFRIYTGAADKRGEWNFQTSG